MAERREQLARTFESAADRYDAARPEYPEALFGDLIDLTGLRPGDRLLEIGCATGKATRPMLERGFSVVCVEPGQRLAEHARANLAGRTAEVHTARFETWEPEHGEFDLVYAATSWHWIDPTRRYRKAHRLLRPGGHLAFWSALHAFPPGYDPFFEEIQEVYEALGHGREAWPPPAPDEVPDEAAEIEATGLFSDTQVRRYVWARTYNPEQYIALLGTFSSHIAMAPADRECLFREVRARIARRPEGRILRHWSAILHVGRRS